MNLRILARFQRRKLIDLHNDVTWSDMVKSVLKVTPKFLMLEDGVTLDEPIWIVMLEHNTR